MSFGMKDSGRRESYDSGMVRDVREGKGRYDLITPFGLKRLADVYEKGGSKYADRNWEKGAPFCRFLDSAMRHIQQYLMGEADEDHLAQGAWNLFAVMHLEETHPELDDRPQYSKVGGGWVTSTLEEFTEIELSGTTSTMDPTPIDSRELAPAQVEAKAREQFLAKL